MTTKRRTVEVPRTEAPLHLAKAAQFLDEARSALSSQRHDAAMLNAVHAAIAAADAVTVALAGRRSADPDHARAVDLLLETSGGGREARSQARRLGELLSRKNAVAYESRRARPQEAAAEVERAARFMAWAGDTIESVRRPAP